MDNKNKCMTDKHNNLVKVGDLVISAHRSSAGQIYRVKEIVPNAAPTKYLAEQGRFLQANCVRVYDRFLSPKDRGNLCSWGYDIIKVDEKYANEMVERWKAVAKEIK
jgi:hypothetical protein